MEAPQIDQRTHADIVAETELLAARYSAWRPSPTGKLDPGGTLIRIFGRFAELIIQRLNRVPEKNFLAFLNLIGTELLPAQPARTLLTFKLAENSPVDAVVPAGTQVAAPPLEGEEDEVIFETTRDLVVTRTQLQAVLVRDTEA
ncbi:MAG: baseplate J/gp47 family protein, partial [bacterium]